MGKSRRANNEGSISKRKDGKWLITLTVGVKDNGKPKKIYRYTKTQAEAVKLLNQLKSELLIGVDAVKGNILVSEWCKTWIDTYKKKLAASTRTSYHTNLRVHINNFIGGVQISKLTTPQIQYMLDRIYNDGENSLSLVIKVFNIINGALKKALELGMIARNPCIGIEFPKDNKKRIRVFTVQEQKTFIKELDNWDSKALFMTYLYTGARLGEIPALTWRDINITERTIDINKKAIVIYSYDGKEKKTKQVVEDFLKTESSKRKIVITPLLVNILQEHKEKQKCIARDLNIEWSKDNLVFPTSNDTVPYTRNIEQKFERITKRISITDATMHSLRHSYASRLFESEVDIKVISKQLGHKTVKTTYDTYIHIMPDKHIKEIDKLSAIDELVA